MDFIVCVDIRFICTIMLQRILQDSSIFKEKKLYWQNMSIVASEIARSNDVFIKHNFDNYDGEVPVWAAVEVLSFGMLSKIIKNLKTGIGSSYSILATNYKYKSKKGNQVNPSQKMLASWIQGVSVLRNMCTHNSRIYNPQYIRRRKFWMQIKLRHHRHTMVCIKSYWR